MKGSKSPIIVLGMHRAGTSMLMRFLSQLGVFPGKKLESNFESVFFHKINTYLLQLYGGRWDYPVPITGINDSDHLWALSIDYLRSQLHSVRALNYLGWRHSLHTCSAWNLPFTWGWKDPKNTYTLPLWLELFPDAKILHIYRHGVDVAHSLKVRNNRLMANQREIYSRSPLQRWIHPKQLGHALSSRCSTIEGGFSLWELYMKQARDLVRRLGGQALEIRYEEFLKQPVQMLDKVAGFCQLSNSENLLENIAAKANTARAYAFREKPELQRYASKVKDRLKMFGYESDTA